MKCLYTSVFSFLMLLFAVQATAQTNAATTQKDAAITKNERFAVLGVERTGNHELDTKNYIAAKKKLAQENPTLFRQYFASNTETQQKTASGKLLISKAKFEKLSPEKQAHVKAHPELFELE